MQLSNEAILGFVGFCLVFLGFISFTVWFLVESYRFTRFEGKIKRGIKVWSKELPYELWQYLSSMKHDVVREKKFLSSSYKTEFIRIQDREVLICAQPKGIESSFICIGYVDLDSLQHDLEYRMSLSGILFLLPFTVLGVLIFLLSFISYKKAIDDFVEKNYQSLTFQSANMETL